MIGQIIDWNLGEILAIYIKRDEIEDINHKYVSICDEILYCNMYGTVFTFAVANIGNYEIEDNAIIRISESGKIYQYLSGNAEEVDIFITNKCNSNCIMCPVPESIRRQEQSNTYVFNKQLIEALPDNIGYINITGGEPTLAKDEFFDILHRIVDKFKKSDFQLLTNGRSFSIGQILNRTVEILPKGTRIAIPIHSSDENIHDMITRAKGSFRQTDMGIKNLLLHKQNIEIRIVVSKANIDSIVSTAEYIAREYSGLLCVNFIAMEMTGNAAVNREYLWIDYDEAFGRIREAIDILVSSGIDVQLYNFPLCAVDRGYWSIAAKSISDYKIRYMLECDECKVKNICGGFFASTKQVMNPRIKPVR